MDQVPAHRDRASDGDLTDESFGSKLKVRVRHVAT
jgi:hypothetical protein